MRILYLTEESIDVSRAMVRGGAIHVDKVVRALRERGHEVTLLDWYSDADGPCRASVHPRVRFVDGPVRTFLGAVDVAMDEAVDVVVSKTRKTYLPGLAAARISGASHVVHVGSFPGSARDGVVVRLDAASLSARLRAPHDGYFVVCEAITEALRGQGVAADRIYNVGNAVDPATFTPDTTVEYPDAVRSAVDEAGDALLVGYAGGLYDYKGVLDIPPALDESAATVHAIVVGDGPEREALDVALGDDGTLVGSIPYEQMPAVYRAIDAFVLPSYTEGLPRVVLEAQATGTPVAATRVGGVPEVVDDGRTGLLFEPGDVEGLADAVDRLAFDSALRERLSRGARESVVERWSWDHLYDRYERSLDDVLA